MEDRKRGVDLLDRDYLVVKTRGRRAVGGVNYRGAKEEKREMDE